MRSHVHKILLILLGVCTVLSAAASIYSLITMESVRKQSDQYTMKSDECDETGFLECDVPALDENAFEYEIEYQESGFYGNGTLALKTEKEAFVIRMPRSNHLYYASSACKIDDQYLFNLVDSGSVRSENYYQFQNEEKENILVHQKKLSEETGLSIAVGNMEETAEAAMQNLVNSISRWNGQGQVLFLGFSVNPEWCSRIIIWENAVTFTREDDTIYIYPCDLELDGAGFTQVLESGEVSITYNGMKDQETGMMIFILQTDVSAFKILAAEPAFVSSLFK